MTQSLDTAQTFSLHALTAFSGVEKWILRNFILIIDKREKSQGLKSVLLGGCGINFVSAEPRNLKQDF